MANKIEGNGLNTCNWKITELGYKLKVSHELRSYVTNFYLGNFHSKSVILLGICLVLERKIANSDVGGLKVHYPVKLENCFLFTFSGSVRVP